MGCDVSVSKLIPVVQSRGLQVNDGIWGMYMTAQRSVKAEVGELFVNQDLSPVSVQSLQPQIGVEEKRDAAKIQNAHFVIHCHFLWILLFPVTNCIGNGNVKIAVVSRVRCARDYASDFLPFCDSNCRGGVEHCLPVSKNKYLKNRNLSCKRTSSACIAHEGQLKT